MTINIPETSPEYDKTRITERPDGFFWQDKETEAVFGPFATLLEAVQDMEYNADSDYEPGESLGEAEAELGIADWSDPDTGLPAEESMHHIEDH
ncbi:MAG: hypothetical protein PHG47_04100 [Sulfuricella sp.]|nr:hypothetical protein [Sulfuricella sp.]